jgi:hypothetical protein
MPGIIVLRFLVPLAQTAGRNACSLVATYRRLAAAGACVLLLTDQTVGSVLASTLEWLTVHGIPAPAAGGTSSLLDVQFFSSCMVTAIVSETLSHTPGLSRGHRRLHGTP